jgi:monovalent cation/proton antiporter MnhG/PhaG subunit
MIVIGSIVMLAGTALSALAAIGVWRFPSAIARMHAATKSASLGLAMVVLGAGLAASSPGIVGIGLLTSALLFLTAPISGHLLGRAAYLTGSDQYQFDALAGSQPIAALHFEPSSRADFSPLRWVGLIAVWVLLWRDLSVGSILGGAAVGFVIELSRRSVSSPVPVNILALARFSLFYLVALVRTNARVAWEVATPFHDDIDEAIVGVPLSVASPQAALLVANAVTFTPGTLTIELAGNPPTLYAHVLHFEGEAELRSEIRRLEKLADAVFIRN